MSADAPGFVDGRVNDDDQSTANDSQAIHGSRDGSAGSQPHMDIMYLPL